MTHKNGLTESEIISGNKLIAEFIGAKETVEGYWIEFPYKIAGHVLACHIKEMSFHLSWDWLMPIVNKIEGIDEDNCDFHIMICKTFTRVVYDYDNYTMDVDIGNKEDFYSSFKEYKHVIFHNDKTATTWCAVVRFIEWWNNFSKNK